MFRHSLPIVLVALASARANAQALNAEFESPGSSLTPLFSYFGGVDSMTSELSPTTIHSGQSDRLTINFQPDALFRIAAAAFGNMTGLTPVQRTYAANADTLSVTIQSPASGQLSFKIALREDDDSNGVLDSESGDDQWESASTMLLPGTNVYNIPLAALTNSGSGNDAQNLSTTPKLGFYILFESRASYSGGMITTPRSILIDHLGLYVGSQTIPTPTCPADVDGGAGNGTPDGGVTIEDLLYYLAIFTQGTANADLDNGSGTGVRDGGVGIEDLLYFLARFDAGC